MGEGIYIVDFSAHYPDPLRFCEYLIPTVCWMHRREISKILSLDPAVAAAKSKLEVLLSLS
jgi:hypothetical protein